MNVDTGESLDVDEVSGTSLTKLKPKIVALYGSLTEEHILQESVSDDEDVRVTLIIQPKYPDSNFKIENVSGNVISVPLDFGKENCKRLGTAKAPKWKCTVEIPSNARKIVFRHRKYEMKKLTPIRFKKDNDVIMRPGYRIVELSTAPPSNIQVLLNDSVVAWSELPKHFSKFKKKKTHTIKAIDKNHCYHDTGYRVTLKRGDFRKLPPFRFKARQAGLDIEAYDDLGNAISADVYAESKYIGQTPLQKAVPKCTKNLKIKYNGKVRKETVRLTEGQTQPLRIDFPSN